MKTIKVRSLLFKTIEELNALPDKFDLIFEDGKEIIATRKKVILSSIFWKLIREYPDTPITYNMYIDSVLDDKPLTSNTHNKLIDNIYIDIINKYHLHTPKSKEHIWKLIYEVVSDYQNNLNTLSSEYVTSIDILDFIELVENDKIKSTVENTVDDYKSIEVCYNKVKDVIKNEEKIQNNPIVIAIKAGLVNINQVLQTIAVRGKVTEVDGTILPRAIMSNFTKGLTDIYEYAAESRSAAKSLYSSDSKLQDSEYVSRRLQQLCMVVENIDYIDCGSNTYLTWTIQGPTKDEKGNIVYAGDLKYMKGKYYLNELDGSLLELKETDTHLIGTTIKLRSSIYCKHPDPHKVCEVCYGSLAKNVSRFVNIGHFSVTTLTQQLTQSILSTKHLDYNSSGVTIILNEQTSRYFITNETKTSYKVKSSFKDKNVKIVINKDEVSGIDEIKLCQDVSTLSPIRLSSIEYIEIVYNDKDRDVRELIKLAQGNKKVIFSEEFIRYIKINKWKLDHRNNLNFDLSNWDFELPIFSLPEVEYSFSDHSVLIAKTIESSVKNIKERCTPGKAESTLKELFYLCNSKINVNLSLLEVIIYSLMVNGLDQYALGRNRSKGELGVAKQCIHNRSLGTAYTYEDITKLILNPRSFFKLDRPDSVFDVFIDPANYLKLRQK